MRKWIESGSCWCADFANRIGKGYLEVRSFELSKKEGKLSFLGDWQVLDVFVFVAFDHGCRWIEPIYVICRQFRLGATDITVKNKTFIDMRRRR